MSLGSKPPRPIRKEQSLEKHSFKQSFATLTKDTSAPELTPATPTKVQLSSTPSTKMVQLPQLPPIAVEPSKKKKKVPRSKKYMDALTGQLNELSEESLCQLKSALDTVPKVSAKSWVT